MKNRPLNRFISAYGLAFAVASVSSALLTVIKEVYPPLKDALRDLTGHHWSAQALWVVALFAVLGYALAQTRAWRLDGWVMSTTVIAATLASAAIVAGFYLLI
jgi:hypothetical protein